MPSEVRGLELHWHREIKTKEKTPNKETRGKDLKEGVMEK